MKTRLKSPQGKTRGFTLVELSIVLVIIGLIIGGVLTGQQIIQNAKITNTVNAIQSYAAQLQTYQQNFGALPGDDANAPIRFSNAGLPTMAGTGAGTITGKFDDTPTGVTESVLAWADLRAAGLVKNQLPITAQPSNPFSGIYGYQTGAFTGGSPALTTTVLCLNNVPGPAVLAIDTKLDDGAPGTGSVQASTGGTTGAVATAYDPAGVYTMCIKM